MMFNVNSDQTNRSPKGPRLSIGIVGSSERIARMTDQKASPNLRSVAMLVAWTNILITGLLISTATLGLSPDLRTPGKVLQNTYSLQISHAR